MPLGTNLLCHIAVVVEDIDKVLDNWVTVLGIERPVPWNLKPNTEVPAYTNGALGDYTDCRLAVIQFDTVILEFVQPGPTPSPWRDTLLKHGQGFQHISFIVPDRQEAYRSLAAIGVPGPYHVGYYPGGAYSFLDSADQLGIEINIKDSQDHTERIRKLLANPAAPLTEP